MKEDSSLLQAERRPSSQCFWVDEELNVLLFDFPAGMVHVFSHCLFTDLCLGWLQVGR